MLPKILLPLLFLALGTVLALRSGNRIPGPGAKNQTWFPVGMPRVGFTLAAAAFLADYGNTPRMYAGMAPLVYSALLALPVFFGDLLEEKKYDNRLASYWYFPFFLLWFFAYPHSDVSIAPVFLYGLTPSVFKRDRTALTVMSGAALTAVAISALLPFSGIDKTRFFSAGLIISVTSVFSLGIMEYMRRRNNDENLRRAQTLYTAVLSHSSELIFTLSPQGIVTSVNLALEKTLQRPRDSILGARFSDFVRSDNPNASIIGADIPKVLSAHYDACVGFASDSCRQVQLSENAMEERGEVTGYLIIATDITERKRLEGDLKEANSRLEALVHLDGLTGVGNRRHFDLKLKEEWERSTRAQVYLSVIIIDVDFFKKYNDAYGHLAGDACLTLVAQTLADQLERSGDTIARYGGEEFAVILPVTDEGGARTVAERMRAAIEGLGHSHEGRDPPGILTISLGIHSLRPVYGTTKETCQDLVDGADKALYEAKRTGRNKACVFTEPK